MKTAIEIRDLTLSIGSNQILENLSLTVGKGEVFGLLGPNGSGKTTTIRSILGFLRPNSGEIRVFDEPVRYGEFGFHKNIGVLGENNNLNPEETVFEYLEFYASLYGIENRKELIEEHLHEFNLSSHQKVSTKYLSKGMKQKLGIIRVLLTDADLFILDEPTSGLDAGAMHNFREMIEEKRQEGKTIVLCSHILSEVEKVVDRVCIFKDGKSLFEGELNELLGSELRTGIISFDLAEPFKGNMGLLLNVPGVVQVVPENKEIRFHGKIDEQAERELEQLLLDMDNVITTKRYQYEDLEQKYLALTGDEGKKQ